MATKEILNSGATSFAAANWLTFAGAAGSGFVDNAELYVQTGTQTITGGLTPSIVAPGGIGNLDIAPGFSGNIGGSSGSLAVETRNSLFAQTTQFPRIRYEAGGGTLYYTAQGSGTATDECHYFQVNGSGSAFLTGTFILRRLEVQSGRLFVAQNVGSVSGYRWVLAGGNTTIDSSSTDLHTLTVSGGQHLLKRGVAGAANSTTTYREGLVVSGGALTIDAGTSAFDDSRIYGGTVTVLNAGNPDVPTAAFKYVQALGGTLDFSRLQRPLIITYLEDAPGCTIIPSKYLTITNRYPIGRGSSGLT